MVLLICWLLAVAVSGQLQVCPQGSNSNCLPCLSLCSVCSSQTVCSSCTVQYYLSSAAEGTCSPCPRNCLQCSNNSVCTQCANPYVLSNNSCSLCTIINALSCSSTVAANACQSGYYLTSGYCNSCLLNCITCSSAYDCSACSQGYYLNTSIITCNPCPVGCSSCNQFTPSTCTACSQGYQLTNNACQSVSCNVSNCVYCSAPDSCQQCQAYYYWNGSVCLPGGSISCEMGANGPLPNNCINSCSSFEYVSGNVSNTFRCKFYSYVYVYPVEYHQRYYYAYNHQAILNSLSGTSTTLGVQNNGEYSYPFTSVLDFGSLPNYYKIVVAIKYSSASNVALNFSATTPTTTQYEVTNLTASTSPIATAFTTTVVHSYNLKVTTNATVNLVEMSLRLHRCSAGCTVCLNQQLCQLCESPNFMLSFACVANCSSFVHFLPNMSCLTSCPSDYYQIISSGSKYCTACLSPCLTCTNASFCLSCVSGYYYHNYNCGVSCPSGYYSDNSTNSCKVCISPCRTCRSSSVCLSCSLGFWDGNQCSSNCPSGFYGDRTQNACLNCDSSCLTCINSATTCTSCNSSLVLYSFQCLTNCPARFFLQSGSCSVCQPPCYTCANSTYCLTCSFNYFSAGSCLSSCLQGYYEDQATLSCLACQSQCKTCTSSFSCSSCITGCLYAGQCPASCPSASFFGQISNGTCSCRQCIYPCSTCSNSSTCLSCVEGYLLGGSCLATCPTSYYGSPLTGICTLCSDTYPNCLSCSSSVCTLCNSNYFLLNGSCLNSCPNFYYPSTKECLLCVAPCLSCSDPSTCLSCVAPYSLLGSTCVMQCSTGMISQISSNISKCVACSSPCLSCSITITNCTYCMYGFYLYNYQCLSNCSSITPLNTFYSQSSTLSCKNCSFPCLTCLSQTQCLSCRVGYLNPSTYACTQCILGTYAFNTTCIACPSECSICYSATYCSGCKVGYFLYKNTCISNSSICFTNGYYVAGNVCYACLQPCSTCSITASNCSSCLSGYIFFPPNQCLIQCPSAYYRNDTQCLQCSPQCSSCVTTSTYCLGCSSGFYLLSINSSCLNQCPSGTFLSGSACSLCQYPCQTCSSEVICLSCITGVLIGSQCYTSCLSGYFATNNLCEPCTSPCKECSITAANCTQCISNYSLLGNTCVVSCPSTYFSESQSGQCLTCVGLCKECSSYINCTACSSQFIFYYGSSNLGQCISSCPVGYYLSNSTCNTCLSQCLTCSDGASCLLCSGTKVQLLGQCLSACPVQMYSLGGVCNNCSFPCENCTDAYTCTSCPTGYILVGGSSCMPGPPCPSGYYLLADASRCDSKCPSGYYNLRNGTCNNVSCGNYHFMGADMFCYSTCPSNYIANRSYYCVPCTTCEGLYFTLTYKIIKDDLYLYLIFTETPQYSFAPTLQLNPSWKVDPMNFPQLVAGTSFSGSTNITLRVNTQKSLTATYLTATFQNQLLTFTNPLQRADSTIYVEGYDYYPADLIDLSSLGLLALVVALLGLGKNPYMLDFAQTLFLVGLVDSHYPRNLASFLESARIAHLHGFISIQQPNSLGEGKFMYLTGTGFLTNTITNWILILAIATFSLILYLLLVFLRKRLAYSKVHDNNESPSEQPKQSFLVPLLENTFESYRLRIFNRLTYFNYAIISLFAMVQMANFKADQTINMIASVLSILTIISMVYYAISLRIAKPKYTFLYIRKLLISGAVVLSLRDAIYAIGIISVCNLTAAVLILTYKLQKYRYQTKFLAVCQFAQLLVQGMISFFIMIGEGNSTNAKVTLCYIIIILIVLILFAYTAEAVMQLICFIYSQCKGVQLRQQWTLNQQEDEESSHHSQSINGSLRQMKTEKVDEKEKKEEKQDNLQTLLVHIKEEMKGRLEQDLERNYQENQPKENYEKILDNKGAFWAYSESQKDEKSEHSEKPPPKMLVRCVNQFSDIDPQEAAK